MPRPRPPTACGADVVVLYAHLPDVADPALFGRISTGAAPIAAGPGWDASRLPAAVAHVDDLSAAVAAITTRSP
jgi:hypothetical protein